MDEVPVQQNLSRNSLEINTNNSGLIYVKDPLKKGEGMNSYVTYNVESYSKDGNTLLSSVARRFSDFVWLHGALVSSFPGSIIYPLPEKHLVGRFSPEFIESRRRSLQKFLNRTREHGELGRSTAFQAFLTMSDDASLSEAKQQIKDASKAATSSGAGGLMQWLEESVHQISTSLGSSMLQEKTESDIKVEAFQQYIDGLEPIITELQTHACGLTKRSKEMTEGLFDFGIAFTLLSQSESECESLNLGLGSVGSVCDQLSMLAAEQTEKELLYFEEPIREHLRMIYAVKAALQKRSDAKLTHQTALGDLESRKASKEKLIKQGQVKKEKLLNAEAEETRAQQRVNDTKKEYDLVTERLLQETARFEREKLADFKSILLDYTQIQVEYSSKIEKEWTNVIKKLRELQSCEPEPVEMSFSNSVNEK